ncbi:MAG: hypothetical protein GWP10_17945 [Nitrospiraceae bacterium]|nr:hypothetical protein [Nitrospiraceae bacterium]
MDTRVGDAGVALALILVSMVLFVIVHAPSTYGASFRVDVGPRIFMGGITTNWPPSFAYEDVWIEGRLWGLDNRIGLLASTMVLHLHDMTLPSQVTYQLGIALQRLWEDDAALRVELKSLNKLHYRDCPHYWCPYYHYIKYFLDVGLSKRWLIGEHNPSTEGFWSDQFTQIVGGFSGGLTWVKGSVHTSWFLEFSVGANWSWVWTQHDASQ